VWVREKFMKLIGHERSKRILRVAGTAARHRNMALPHMLFSGAPGCGKTSMARELASAFKLPFLSIVPDSIKDTKSVLKLLEQLDHSNYSANGDRTGIIRPTIVFFDEAHNMPLKGQELIGLVMERFILESGQPNKFVWSPYFTVVAATTLAGKLSKPFLDRLKLQFSFELYEMDEMMRIVEMHAVRLGVATSKEGMEAIARRSRGTPRVAVRYIEAVRDRMLADEQVFANLALIEDVFSDLGIDREGFSRTEIKILQALLDAGGPVSLNNLAVITAEDIKSIQGTSEPFLIQKGMIITTGKGRTLTPKGTEYIRSSGGGKKFVKNEIAYNAVRK
jgi:Holliday junction DNA helicase RuvB